MKNLSAKKQKELLEIAKKAIYAIEERGSLEAKGNDSEDFSSRPRFGALPKP